MTVCINKNAVGLLYGCVCSSYAVRHSLATSKLAISYVQHAAHEQLAHSIKQLEDENYSWKKLKLQKLLKLKSKYGSMVVSLTVWQ